MWQALYLGIVPGLFAGASILVSTLLLLPGLKKDPDLQKLDNRRVIFSLGVGGLFFSALIIGPLFSYLYEMIASWVSNPSLVFRVVMLGFAVFVSAAAFLSKLPATIEKAILCLVVVLVLGVAVPWLHR